MLFLCKWNGKTSSATTSSLIDKIIFDVIELSVSAPTIHLSLNSVVTGCSFNEIITYLLFFANIRA
ncbi:hypothetical protein MY04_4784 [Flammeovirga sp. MY04]|uniref:hypothetical protein n=1 Tax=Flammeovirga sp. MY04 TaxID=1191459 RepID=UPI0008063E8E|nr:hypothetical protein [Flammeovirga sp. MY04]ANQ49601.1 hypothetical protein MY04_2227 [Flammeovirga sp. MY04]ANQ52119.1 hypothetical protein MY04_4784 [Flammeovirga sp. MY04]